MPLYDLDDVCSHLEEIKQEIHDLRSSSSGYVLAFLVGVFLFALLPGWVSSAWHANWRYGYEYDVPFDKIHRESKPHDCAFLAAPLGEKYCHYNLVVTTIRWATSTTGNPIVSYDNGKTWFSFTPEVGSTVPKFPTVEEVNLTWEKEEDQ